MFHYRMRIGPRFDSFYLNLVALIQLFNLDYKARGNFVFLSASLELKYLHLVIVHDWYPDLQDADRATL